MQSYPIFKANHPVTSMEGVAVSFSEDELRAIAQRYDVSLHEAPITVGHPSHDAPAYGWIMGLGFADGCLIAQEHQVNADFDALRKNGAYKKLSARFYTPASANNPTPGAYYLRDVGFLGAMPPAVKGLKLTSFAEGSEVVTLELSFGDLPGYFGLSIARMFQRVRDYFIDKEGLEKADQIVPAWEINSLSETAQRADMQPREPEDQPINSFSEPAGAQATTPTTQEKDPMKKTPEQLQAELDAANASLAQLHQEKAQQAAAQRQAEAASFADQLIADAKWPAGHKDVLVTTLAHLMQPAAEGQALSFGEGDAAKPLAQALREAMQELLPSVSFGEMATKAKADGEAAEVVSFNDQPGYQGVVVDAALLEHDKRIKAHAKEKGVSYAVAAAALAGKA